MVSDASVQAHAHASELGARSETLCVAGDSAGGNLAAAVALMARDRGDPRIAFQLLVSPVSCAVGCSWRCVLQAFGVVQCIPCNKFRDPRTLA